MVELLQAPLIEVWEFAVPIMMPMHKVLFSLSLSHNTSIAPVADRSRASVGYRNPSRNPRPVLVCQGVQQLGGFLPCGQSSNGHSSCCSPIGCVIIVLQKN